MPLIFIHGVNTREDSHYQASLKARDVLLRRYILESLAGGRHRDMAIVNAYWGDLGADFAWGLRSVPGAVQAEAALGGRYVDGRTPQADSAMAALSLSAAGPRQEEAARDVPHLASLRELAAADLPALMEAMLGAIAYDEWPLALPQDHAANPQERAARQGEREALLLVAADEVGHDPALAKALRRVHSDEEVLDLIKDAVSARYRDLLRASDAAPRSDRSEIRASGLESGMTPRWIVDLSDQAAEILDRARGAPLRAASSGLLHSGRRTAHQAAARFLGDVFVYLQHRGDRHAPGPIVQRVLAAVNNAPRAKRDEPLIVLTHSMGGNIFYDILTHFAPELKADAWISVGGQVAQFEEIKLFKASVPGLKHPEHVPSLGSRVGVWLNVYDPADVFSFLAEPVFEGVRDLRYSTGSALRGAHGDYFKRPSFYRLLAEQLGHRSIL